MAADTGETQTPFMMGAVRVDPGRLSLESDAGQSQLEPKVMQLLSVLAQKAGEAVSRDQLIDAVWGVQFGGDESLSRAISLLRKALAMPHGVVSAIRTIPRRGYVLDVDVSTVATSEPATTRPATPDPLIAVLPFDNLSSDADTEFFSDGVSEDIIDRLVRGTDLKVIGRTSSFQFRGDRKFAAAEELGAAYIVDGSVRRAGNRVRISATLERADTRETLWSDRYDRNLEDIFAVQDEISEQIALALNRKMESQRQTVMAPETYDLFLHGRDWTQTPERLMDAIGALEEVTKAAPDFAPAWGALARNRALMRMYSPIQMRKELGRGVDEAIENALRIEPRTRDALNASYQRLDHYGDMVAHHDAISELRGPNRNAAGGLFLVCFHETCIGRIGKAVEMAFEAARLDPFNMLSACQPGMMQSYAGDWDAARENLERDIKMWPEEPDLRTSLAFACAYQGDADRVEQLTDPRALRNLSLHEWEEYIKRARLLARGDKSEWLEYAESERKRMLDKGAADTNDLTHVGLFGGADMFFDAAEQVRLGPTGAEDDALGPMSYRSTLIFHAGNESLRADPRCIKFCARLGLVKFWMETGIRPDFADEVEYDFDDVCREYADVPLDTYNPF